MKVIRVNTPKGQYDIPLKLVAEHRATYYEPNNKKGWTEEVEWVVDDNFEGIDWMANNMDWKDIEPNAIKINNEILVTDEDFFCSTDDFVILDMVDKV